MAAGNLQAGIRYCLKFRYAYGDTSTHLCDGLGGYFSADSTKGVGFLPLVVTPQVSEPDGFIMVDTANWLLFHKWFVAVGG